jgi:hypothetical protein
MLVFYRVFGQNSYQTSEKIYINLTEFFSLTPEGILIKLLENARCNGVVSPITVNNQLLEYNNQKLYTLAILFTMNQLLDRKKAHIYRIKVLNHSNNAELNINEL